MPDTWSGILGAFRFTARMRSKRCFFFALMRRTSCGWRSAEVVAAQLDLDLVDVAVGVGERCLDVAPPGVGARRGAASELSGTKSSMAQSTPGGATARSEGQLDVADDLVGLEPTDSLEIDDVPEALELDAEVLVLVTVARSMS